MALRLSSRQSYEERGLRQRSLAFISFSFLIHIALIVFVVSYGPSFESGDGGGSFGFGEAAANDNSLNEVVLNEPPARASNSGGRRAAAPAPAPRLIQETGEKDDVQIREAIAAARAETPPANEPKEEELPSLSPEVAEIEDVMNEEPLNAVSELSADGGDNSSNDANHGSSEASSSGSGSSDGRGGNDDEADGPTSNQNLVIVEASQRRPLPGNPLPAYPRNDRYLKRQGTTVMVGRVGTDGRVQDVQIERSSGSESMDRASVTEFRKWRFEPGQEALVRKSFAFTLKGEEKIVPARLGSSASQTH